MPETRTILEATARMAVTMGVGIDDLAGSATTNVVRRSVRLDETAASIAWLTLDLATGIAGQVINVCGGAIVSR